MGRGDARGSAADRCGAAPAAPYEQEQPAGVLEDAPHGCHAWAMPGDGPLDPPGLSAPPAAGGAGGLPARPLHSQAGPLLRTRRRRRRHTGRPARLLLTPHPAALCLLQPRQIEEIKEFLLTARRKDARSVKIKKTGDVTKFKVPAISPLAAMHPLSSSSHVMQ